jgi:RNA polymerase sigma factor for flagellar operon FliA
MQYSPIAHDDLTYAPRRAQTDADALIKTHSQLVRRIAWHVHSRMSSAIAVEDLIQIGMIALIEAARTFEDRGISFIPYASMRVRGAMIDELRRDARMCRSGMVNRRRLAQVRTSLENKLERSPSDCEMAEALALDASAYHALVASTQAVQQHSLDEVYSDHDIWFADQSDTADTMLEQSEMRAMLAQNIAQLAEREAMVLQLYFAEEMNLDEIGETLGVGAARVCQIKKAALDKLREMMMD